MEYRTNLDLVQWLIEEDFPGDGLKYDCILVGTVLDDQMSTIALHPFLPDELLEPTQ